MTGILVGFRTVDYKKKDGTDVFGCNLYFTTAIEGVNATGCATKDVFVNYKYVDTSVTNGLKVGKTYKVFFNQYGGFEEILEVPVQQPVK